MKIQKDEKQDVEFKKNWRDEYLKWICAFSNTHGGVLYVGVMDDGEICGIKDFHKLSEDIPNKILQTMGLIYTKYMKAFISYDGIHRKESFFFPKEAFRELLLNAVIHRDYMKTTPIQIKVYAHKIRIWNIGKMPVDVPVEKLFEPHSSEPRNPNIANVFFKAGYVESWGRGYKNISDICKVRKAKLPKPEENSGGLVVECPPSRQYLDAEKKQGKIVADAGNGMRQDGTINGGQIGGQIALNERQSEIVHILKEKPYTTRKELAQLFDINESAVQKHLETLKQKGVLVHVGKTRGYWEVKARP